MTPQLRVTGGSIRNSCDVFLSEIAIELEARIKFMLQHTSSLYDYIVFQQELVGVRIVTQVE